MRTQSPQQEILVVGEVAEILRTSPARIYRLVREDRIAGVIHLGRQLRFDRGALLEWIQSGGYRLPGGWREEAEQQRPMA